MGNIVAIVGRPNVGKSTLFNRLTESKAAIVESVSGVTRDRHYGKVEWGGRNFSLIDTGGYVRGSDDVFEEEIRKQVQAAIEEANLLIFMVDATTGITDLDQSVADIIRRSGKPVILAANKVDTAELIAASAEFYSFGLGEVYYVSATNGFGTGEFMDAIVDNLEEKSEEDHSDLPRIAVVGKPNVGKSSLVNALIGEERNIVTNISGTTRDAIDTRYNAFGFDFILVDTAGIRKKAKVHEDIEFYSVLRSVRAIENADVCLFMIDATEGMQKQDLNIFYMIEQNKKGVVVLVNKWDEVKMDSTETKAFEDAIRQSMAPFTDVPILFVSAHTKQRVHKALETAIEVYQNRVKKIPTNQLNEVMLEIIGNTPPPAYKGKWIKIKFVTQLPTHSPSFAFFCNLPQYIREPYKRFVENQLREHFDFTGVPLRIFFRKK